MRKLKLTDDWNLAVRAATGMSPGDEGHVAGRKGSYHAENSRQLCPGVPGDTKLVSVEPGYLEAGQIAKY